MVSAFQNITIFSKIPLFLIRQMQIVKSQAYVDTFISFQELVLFYLQAKNMLLLSTH